MSTKLSIAIVNWNTCDLTVNCIQSIIENTKRISYELIVVDNASSDDSVKVIREKFPQVIFIKNSANLMFAEPNNQALEISRGKYFLLLNSDTIVHGDALEQMVGFLDTHTEAGAVTCKFLNPDGSIQYNMHRRFPTFTRLASGFIYKRYPKLKTKWAKDYLLLDCKFDKVQKIEQAAAACIMIRKEKIKLMGGLFDAERFPLLYNDVDLCYRLHKKGFAIYLISSASITHFKSQGFKKLASVEQQKERFVSMLWFFRKHRKYLDYFLTKISSFLFCSLLVCYWTCREPRGSLKSRLALPLSVLLDRKVELQ